MVNINNVMSAIDKYIDSRVDMIVGKNPIMNLVQPFIRKAFKGYVNNYTDQIKNYLKLISDKNGNVDIDSLLDEVINRFDTMDETTIATKKMGDIHIGKGKLVLEVPSLFGLTANNLVFTTKDITDLKSMIMNNNGNF